MILVNGTRIWIIPNTVLIEYDEFHAKLTVYSMSRKKILEAEGVYLKPEELDDVILKADFVRLGGEKDG